jgi:outer membrane protein W
MKKIPALILILVSVVVSSAAEDKKFQAALMGGWSHIFQYGTTEQYEMGSNDFPVMPGHSSPCFGIAFQYLFVDRLGIELEGLYYFSSRVTLVDPWDQDNVQVSTAERFSVGANLKFYVIHGEKIGTYLIAGGGIDKMFTKEREYTSANGYKVNLTAPPKSVDRFAGVGIGLEYNINPSFGLKMDTRYRVIFAGSDRIKGINAMAGIFVRL